MSLAQACAEVEAAIERARALFGAAPASSSAGIAARGHLGTASASTSNTATSMSELSGTAVSAHHVVADRSALALRQAASTDAALATHVEDAAALSQAGAARLDSLAQESRATSQAAATVTTPAGQRAILTALKSQAERAARVVDETQQRSRELTGRIRLLDYPLEPPPSVPEPPDPNHLPESTIDGIHGTGSRDMPIIKKPGELGPPNTGMNPGGTNYEEAIPGSGVWIPSDQITGKLWMPSFPGELAPPHYEEIAPGIWWPQPPSVDPAVDHPSYRGG